MPDVDKQEIELTDDLLDYVRRSTIQQARKRCPTVDPEDVVQEVMLHLVSSPPKFDPTKGASVKTLLFTILQRRVLKYAERYQRSNRGWHSVDALDESTVPVTWQGCDLDRLGFLDYIDCEESRQLCKMMLEFDFNKSEVARRLGVSEGTVRYRFSLIAGKLLAAGFDPFGLRGAADERGG